MSTPQLSYHEELDIADNILDDGLNGATARIHAPFLDMSS